MKRILFSLIILTISFNLFAQQSLSNAQKEELVLRHNFYRQAQGAQNISWSDKLAAKAQDWAKIMAKKDKLMHSSMKYGENIYVSTVPVSPSHVVDRWASEKKYYHGEKITTENFHLFGHYTQIIWNLTTEVGCAKAIAKSGRIYWVCEYSPAGNYINEKPVEHFKE